MSMTGNYLQVTSEQLAAVIGDPSTAEALTYPDDEVYPQPPDALDIDEAWHLIQFLLTGQAWNGEPPLAYTVFGGAELKGTDGGYGPIRYLTPDQVSAVAIALTGISADTLWSKFNAEQVRAADIYPEGWGRSIHDQPCICGHYSGLQAFYQSARQRGNAVLQYLA